MAEPSDDAPRGDPATAAGRCEGSPSPSRAGSRRADGAIARALLRDQCAAARASQGISDARSCVRAALDELHSLFVTAEPHRTDSLYLELCEVELRLAVLLGQARHLGGLVTRGAERSDGGSVPQARERLEGGRREGELDQGEDRGGDRPTAGATATTLARHGEPPPCVERVSTAVSEFQLRGGAPAPGREGRPLLRGPARGEPVR